MDNDKYIGRLLDNRYEILEVIGVGGMAVVYKARCHRLNRLVAIKILKDDYCQDEEFRRRFHAEGQAVAMVSHPNIVSVYDVSSSQDADFIVMELIDGISLKQYMEKKGVLNWKETLHFAMQIGKALEHAHSRGIVHRDIKPHNIMVLKNGSVKVADFGIARVMSESHTLTREALGSVHYISPEQAKGGRVDDRSDIYSLGVVMYEMITGRPPYNGESPVAVAIQHINGGAKMPSTLNPNIPGGLEQIIMKAMALEPSARYASAAVMLSDMDEFRKMPAMLFDYNLPPIDDVTRLNPIPVVSGTGSSQSVRTGTGPVRSNTGRTGTGSQTGSTGSQSQPARRTAAQMSAVRAVQKNAEKAAQARRSSGSSRRNAQEEEEKSKIATIAIIGCSVAAVIAILIFVITLFGGESKPALVSVPSFIGKDFETLELGDSFVLAAPQYEYHEVYEKGQITYQLPQPGEKVEAGTNINLTISLGQMPQIKTMENLVGQQRSTAENFVVGQGFLFLSLEESSDTVKAGLVTRTEPAAGEALADGQTIKLYISTGPDIQEIQMPNVVKQNVSTAQTLLSMQGLELNIEIQEENSLTVEADCVIRTEPSAGKKVKTGDTVTLYVSTGPEMVKMPNVVGKDLKAALDMLDYAGFTNIDYTTYVDSDRPENEVVSQSVKEKEEVPINTKIVLELSKGPTVPPTTVPPTVPPTEPPTVPPTEPPTTTPPATQAPAPVEKKVTVDLVDGMTEDYKVVITQKNTGEVVYDAVVNAQESSVVITVKGTGTVRYDVSVDGVWLDELEVVFTQ